MSRQLLIRADDLGICEAVNHGIAKAVSGGVCRSAGLMTNMPAAAHGVELLRGTGVSLGQHSNVCLGRPLCQPETVPSLVRADGTFHTSREYRNAAQDFVDVEDAVRELEAQLHRFRELTGKDPDYFEAHAVQSANLSKALELTAERNGLRYFPAHFKPETFLFGRTQVRMILPMEAMQPQGYDAFAVLKENLAPLPEDGVVTVYVCHPGYLDKFLLDSSSLTAGRTSECAMLADPGTARWLEEQGFERTGYNALEY